MKNYIIIADGEFLSTDFILNATKNKIIIALDGAADRLADLNIKPHVILGDFDTINPIPWGIQKTYSEMGEDDQPYFNQDNIHIVPAKNQQYTDLQKAIHYCNLHQAASITIICAMGGRLDHHEGNLRILRSAYRPNRSILFHTERE
ncbi:MAG: motility associated factor glycosyltransferase family protein, partial [Gammaproteobacteria bacterium]